MTRPSLSPWGFQAGLMSKGACVARFVSSTCPLYVNAADDFGEIDERSIINSSFFSSETYKSG
jgi:hypothetical protein